VREPASGVKSAATIGMLKTRSERHVEDAHSPSGIVHSMPPRSESEHHQFGLRDLTPLAGLAHLAELEIGKHH